MAYQKFKKHYHTFLWDVANGAGADSATATGVIPIFSAPANCLIHSCGANVITAVGGSSAEELGDGTDVDGYLADGFAANAGVYPTSAEDSFCGVFSKATTAGATDALDVSNSLEKKLYSSADTIDWKISGTATSGKVRFFVEFEIVA